MLPDTEIQFLPRSAIDADKRQREAREWARQQRAQVAAMWAASARQQADAMVQGIGGFMGRTGEAIGGGLGQAGQAIGNAAQFAGETYGPAWDRSIGGQVLPAIAEGVKEQARSAPLGQIIAPYSDEEVTQRLAENPTAQASVDVFNRVPGTDQATANRRALNSFNLAMGIAGDRAPGTVGKDVTRLSTSSNPANQTLGKMYDEAVDLSNAPGLRERLNTTLTRQWTDRAIDLKQFQEQAAKAKGRPLNADEMAYELSRLNPDMAAQVRIQEGLRPAIRSVGEDRDWLSAYLTHQDNIDVARAMGQKAERAKAGTGAAAEANRSFSGGLKAADSAQALADMPAELGPQRFAQVEQAAQQVQSFSRQLLQRKVDAGIISQDLFNELTTRYPHYSPTRILDYLKDPARVPVGKSLSLRDRGLRENTLEGTTRAREDPLASMVRLAYDTEAAARKNEAFNAVIRLRDMIPGMDQTIREVPASYTTRQGETALTGFVNGERRNYVVPKELETAIRQEAIAPIPGITTALGIWRALVTSRNPLFLARNAINDAGTYAIRESSRMGGPQNLPVVLRELFRSYGDAFGGLWSGEFKGNTAEFLKSGGGQWVRHFSLPISSQCTPKASLHG